MWVSNPKSHEILKLVIHSRDVTAIPWERVQKIAVRLGNSLKLLMGILFYYLKELKYLFVFVVFQL